MSNDFTPLSPNDTFLPPGADNAIPGAYFINVSKVDKSLSRVKTDKAVGPDGTPNWILHDYATILTPPVCAIFNSSLREGAVPMLWKCADIRPIPKVRPATLIHKDIRPISLTPVLSKCLEKLIHFKVDPKQYGSIKGPSTAHALIELVHEWKYALDTPETTIRILLVDFSKVFDRVDHHTLLIKCTSLGLLNFIMKWLTSFLCQRKQRVKIGNVKSNFITINAGVPQGTIFGPIGLQTSCGHVKYVDDCTIWKQFSPCGHNNSLQTAATEPLDIPPLTINDRPIEQVKSTRLLGVTLTADLKWHSHIDEITVKASQRLYFIILLNRAGVESENLVNIYTSLVDQWLSMLARCSTRV